MRFSRTPRLRPRRDVDLGDIFLEEELVDEDDDFDADDEDEDESE